VLLATCKDPAQLSSLRCLAVGGEVLNPETLALAQRMLPHATILNCYGPTEASCMVTAYNCTSAPAAQLLSVPIGQALPGTALYVLDPGSLQPVADGQPGELCVSGICLARGYAGRPDLTQERFLPNPHCRPGDASVGRFYRTGDLVSRLPDGNMK
jgi:non-ribosomal peptide synthetase component F